MIQVPGTTQTINKNPQTEVDSAKAWVFNKSAELSIKNEEHSNAILSQVNSGVSYAMAGKLSPGQLTTLNAQLKAMDNLQSSFMKPTGIINTESFRALGRRRARGSEFKEAGQRLKAQRTQGFKEAMEAADDLIIEKSAGTISRTDLKNLSPEALQNLRLEFAPDIMARFFKRNLAGGGMVALTDDIEAPESAGLANILAV